MNGYQELLRQVLSQLPPEGVEFGRDLKLWVTDEKIAFVLSVTAKAATSLLATEWGSVPPNAPETQQLLDAPGYVMLRELATSRQSDENGSAPHFPEKQVLHFCQLWTVIETNSMTPAVAEGVCTMGEAEKRLVASPSDRTARENLHLASQLLDTSLDGVMSDNAELNGLVSVVFLFLYTDAMDQALKIEV